MDINSKFDNSINKFIELVKKEEDIIGILVSGSFVTNQLDENSDVDIHLILDEKCNYRERGNTWIDGVEIEYFKNPPKQIRSYYKKESENPHTANMFLNSFVKYKKSNVVDALIKEAKEIMENKPQSLKDFEIEISKYHLDDLLKDLKDCLAKKDKVNFRFVKEKLVYETILVAFKVFTIRKTKEKRLFEQIKSVDKKLAKLIVKTQEERVLEIKKVEKLVKYVEQLLGGKRSKEWKLRSGLDL